MIAVDTNVLIYAHREDSPWHAAALEALTGLAEGRSAWRFPGPAFTSSWRLLRIPASTGHPRRLRSRSIRSARGSNRRRSCGSVRTSLYWDALRECLSAGRVVGPQVHDARVAALCLAHGVRELWTHDRDFGRFSPLVVRNPLV